MLTVFFDYQDVVHHEYAPKGQTITKEYYIDVFRRLRDAARRKRPEFKESGSWKLHHDNAPAHLAHVVQQFLAKHGIPVVSQPPYSPDLAPWAYFSLTTQGDENLCNDPYIAPHKSPKGKSVEPISYGLCKIKVK
ncbi:hypothetical protein QTP88_018467 [Uroleucon formosanum]